MNSNMILLDLFSGIGGFHLGLERAGFEFDEVYFSEIDTHAIANYKNNFKNSKYVGDVKSISTSGIRRPNIITFGSPCQNFSMAGRREGLGGEQSGLIKYALAAISKFRPDVFIWENVKGAFSSNNSEDFWAIIQAFANIGGYRLEWQLLNTSWFLPQNRERIYLVGHLATSFPNWKPIFPITEDAEVVRKANKANEDRVQAQYCSTLGIGYGNRQTDTYIASKIAGCLTGGGHSGGLHSDMDVVIHSRGRGFCKDTISDTCPTIRGSSFEHNTSVFLSEPRHKHGEDRIYTNVAPTVQARYGTGGDNIPYVSNIRRLTEIECERLQGFPDDWTKYGDYGEVKEIAKTNRYKLIGNAVTVDIVKLVAERIKRNYEF